MKPTAYQAAIAAASVLALATTATASVTLAVNNSNPQATTALTGFGTTGAMMDGMNLTAYFANGSSQSAVWGDTGASSGAAVGTGWGVAMSGDTFGGSWTLSNSKGTALTRLLIDAGIGGTIYDVNFDSGSIGTGASSGGSGYETPGSARGWSFDLQSGSTSLDILATYSGPVGVGGNAPVGDLYRYLNLDFRNTDGLASGTQITYITDTDNAQFGGGDVNPVPETVSTLLTLGLSGMGLFALRRRIS